MTRYESRDEHTTRGNGLRFEFKACHSVDARSKSENNAPIEGTLIRWQLEERRKTSKVSGPIAEF